MPLIRRLPKRGFNNAAFRDTIAIVNLDSLEKHFESGATVDEIALREAGLVRGKLDAIKLLGRGEITKSLLVEVDLASASAKEKLEKAGGSLKLRERQRKAPKEASAAE